MPIKEISRMLKMAQMTTICQKRGFSLLRYSEEHLAKEDSEEVVRGTHVGL